MRYNESMTCPSTYYTHCDSPCGPLLLTSDGTALTGLSMTGHKDGPAVAADWVCDPNTSPFAETKRQLDEYFAASLRDFTLPLAPTGTAF